MKEQRCLICKYLGDHSEKYLCHDKIYREQGQDILVHLCYSHSWELFRLGQKKFLNNYKSNFTAFLGTETETALIEYVRGEKKKGFGSWTG
jgi:hypothetical protein